jgi:hypothetical protein
MRDLLKSNVSRGCSVRNLASFQVVNLWRVVVLFGVVVSFSIKMADERFSGFARSVARLLGSNPSNARAGYRR